VKSADGPTDSEQGPPEDPELDLGADPDYETALQQVRESLGDAYADATFPTDRGSPEWLTGLLDPATPEELRRDATRVLPC